jgi:CheY-like chemotaxis protein
MERSHAVRRHLLLVEDNPGDVHLVREAFARRPEPPEIVDVPDGLAALEYLRGDGERPDLILLDLNLPRMDGGEFLAVAKNDESLRRIPIVVLSSVDSEADIDRLYGLRANGYHVKPADLASLFALVERIDEYWLHASTLPGRNGGRGRDGDARGRTARAGEARRWIR